MPYSVLSGTVWGIFPITIVTICYNCFHSYKTCCLPVLTYLVLYYGDKDLGRLSGVCDVYVVAYGVVFDGYYTYFIFGVRLYFNCNTDFQDCNVTHHNNNFDHVWGF